MPGWKPPKGTKVEFRIEANDGPEGRLSDARYEKVRAEFLARFKLPAKGSGYFKLNVDDARWPTLLDAIDESRSQNLLKLGACWLVEPEPRATDPTAWFIVWSGNTQFRSAKRAPAGMHYSEREDTHEDVASQRFFDVVRDAGLKGLDWLPLEDTQASDPMVWRQVFATHAIGRGLDHPLIDPAKHEKSLKGLDPARRWGEAKADRNDILAEAFNEHPLIDRLISTCPKYFRVAGPRRFVKEHLPPTDFAYMGWGFERDKGPGTKGRPVRTLCCNAKAREVLVEAGLIKASRLEPLKIVPAAEADAAILDATVAHPLPPPIYTSAEAAVERARREAAMHVRVPKERTGPTFATIEEAIAFLTKRLGEKDAPWKPAGEMPEFAEIRASKLFVKAPKAWQKIAHLLPLETTELDTEFTFQMQAPAWNDWLPDEPAEDPSESPSKKDLVLATTAFGDWFAVRRDDPKLPEEARIVQWDHETMSIHDEWASVAGFVGHVVEQLAKGGQ